MLHVLLVEDNPADVLLVREGIRASTIEADVLIAYDGDQAMRFLDELNFKPDLIILDLNIPKFHGLALLERYRAKIGAPVVVLTSSDNPQDKTRAMESGAREYIVKPATFQEFIDTVQGALDRWGRSQTAAAS